LIDHNKNIEFPLKKKKGKLDIGPLFDVLVEYVNKKDFSLIAFIDYELTEKGFSDNDILLGRACGDRVCVISLMNIENEENFKEILNTTIHEFLHTMGIDHCVYWKCLMNSNITISEIVLCPIDSAKLMSELKYNHLERL
jgi:predicted Zn-dependent protease